MTFPPRDPNERVLMSSLGVDSPMFDYVEQISGKPTPTPDKNNSDMISSNKKSKEIRREQERQAKQREE